MVIGFKKQFVEPILTGRKVHTIREDKKDRWREGMTMHMYTGGRFSKEYHEFYKKECICVQPVIMTYYVGRLEVSIGDTYLFEWPERNEMAISDGFENWEEFEKWWIPIVDASPKKVFQGKVIHWTDLKY